jgi:hypothetical protein
VGAVFAVGAVVSLVLSPITALYAALIGVLGFCIALIAGRGLNVAAAAFGGVAAGSLPYIVGGLLI